MSLMNHIRNQQLQNALLFQNNDKANNPLFWGFEMNNNIVVYSLFLLCQANCLVCTEAHKCQTIFIFSVHFNLCFVEDKFYSLRTT